MKRFLQKVLFAFVVGLFAFSTLFAQASFDNGDISIELNDLGRIRIYTPGTSTQQIDRSSLLFGTAPSAVFNYNSDAESVIPATSVSSPASSDFELYVVCDNSYSNASPAILEKINIYGWTTGGYAVTKITVINNETSAVNGINGIEILPRIDGSYGNETVKYLSSDEVVSIFKSGGTYVGYKFFNPAIVSLKSFEWFSGYDSVDDSLYNWLTYGNFDPEYNAGADGAVAIMAQAPVNVGVGDSTTFYLGISIGANEAQMLANMGQAEIAYNNIITGISSDDLPIPNEFVLHQNYPNPFNPSTVIPFSIDVSADVTLEIYNVLGQKVATLLNKSLAPGNYKLLWNGENNRGQLVESGVYFYKLRAVDKTGEKTQVRKMILAQ